MKPTAKQSKPVARAGAAQAGSLAATTDQSPMVRELYRRAAAQLRKQPKSQKAVAREPVSDAEARRLLHELQVHHVELEIQNAELQEARGRTEAALEKYTDLYDFAPVGYLSLDEQGRITEANLTGAAMLGVGRSRLLNRGLPFFVTLANRPDFRAFLKQIFAGAGRQVCEAVLLREGGASFWANIHGTAALSANGPRKCCRVVVSDITALKLSEAAQRRLEALAEANRELREEIVRRQSAEASLKESEQHQRRLLEESRVMQDELRHLSRQVLQAQEEERKRVSRELHDVIAQTLTGINVQLAALARMTRPNTRQFDLQITRTQKLVERSVDIVHQFARELRPAVLDDLGLIPALHSFLKQFTARTGVRAHLTAFAGIEQLDLARRTVLFRVAQEALANIARHARATRAEVIIQKLPDAVCMRIKDDGQSFQVECVMKAKGGKRLGLLGMRERLEMVGGRFEIASAPGEGTTVQACVPFSGARAGVKVPLKVSAPAHR